MGDSQGPDFSVTNPTVKVMEGEGGMNVIEICCGEGWGYEDGFANSGCQPINWEQ